VIYPAVSISNIEFRISNIEKTSYYLTVARLEKTKHIDVLIRAANKKQYKLVIVGTGRDEERLKLLAGKTVTFTGSIDDKKLQELYKGAKAFLFAATDEEFGIVTIEAMSYGLPVIALKSGGLKETVKEGYNGYLYDELNENSIIKKIEVFEKLTSNEYKQMKKNSRKESEKYSEEVFKKNILNFVARYRNIK
jgi:glycosyltransferase involved in cell wall biosynthesis